MKIITDLRPDEEFRLLREQFWSDLHANMFFIYVTLTKGQRSSFKQFLSGGDDRIAISSEFLRLYRCFKKAGDRYGGEGRGGRQGAAAPVKKKLLGGLSPPKIICCCDGEPSIIRDTLIEHSRSRYSNRAVTVFFEEQCSKLRM